MAGIFSLAFVIWQIRQAFLVAFAGVIVAAILISAAEPIERLTSMRRRWALLLAGLCILLVFGLFGALVGAQVTSQVSTLFSELPQAIDSIEQRLGISLPSPQAIQQQSGNQADSQTGPSISRQLLSSIAAWGLTVFQVLTSLVLIIIAGAFFSAEPSTYRRGLVMLFPKSQHARLNDALIVCGRSLRLWLLGQLVSMFIVGALVGVGTWLIGLPNPLALGLFAGIAEFVPVIGPIVGAIPALVFAATQGMNSLLWTAGLFLAIQQVESNLIMPMVEKKVMTIPPGLFLISVLAFGLLFGVLGVILAAPLTVIAYVAVKKLYVRETLGQETDVPGEG